MHGVLYPPAPPAPKNEPEFRIPRTKIEKLEASVQVYRAKLPREPQHELSASWLMCCSGFRS